MTISLSHNNNRNSNLLKGIPVLLVVMIFQYSNLKSSEISDSLKKEFPEVKVYSTRIITNSLGEFSPLTILKKEDISSRASINLSEALVYVPGVFIKDYGGLGGMKTVSLRGSSSSQSLLMINGVRLNSSQNGSLDLSNLPISVIDNIEIIGRMYQYHPRKSKI
jgi:outer membrane cobalamin receptor